MSPENDPLLRLWADQRAKQTRSSVGVLQVGAACIAVASLKTPKHPCISMPGQGFWRHPSPLAQNPAFPVGLCTHPVS